MDTHDAMLTMLGRSGLTAYRVSVALGRHSSYVSTMLRRGSCPSADLLARLASVCGWRLVLVPPDGLDLEALTIDGGAPPSDAD